MATIHFKKSAVQKLIAATEASSKHHVPYTGGDWETPEDNSPGLILVGDMGVYLMSNRTDEDNNARSSPDNVVYAKECPPDNWEAKQRIFGGDDGAEFLPLEEVKTWVHNTPGSTLALLVTPKNIGMCWPSPRKA